MKIILFDDHALFAKSIEIAIQDQYENFLTYTHKENFADIIRTEQPDIVLMDIHMGDKNGLKEGRDLIAEFPNLKLIFLSGYNFIEYHEEAIKMGAKAFISKEDSLLDLAEKLAYVAAGNMIFPTYQKDTEELSAREKEVLQLAASGHSQQEIADILGVSRRTISSHIQTILQKFHVNSTIAATIRGIEMGIVKIHI